jgi:LuxR family maltose regulon positive regulatory protein
LERLGKYHQRPLTLVTAPAGYGKSSLISNWLEGCDCPSAWVALDKNDNNMFLFVSYFLSTLQSIFPDAGRKILAMVNSSSPPPVSALSGSLLNALARIEQPFILVLDDYHHIQDKSVHDLLIQLLAHPPQSLHLVMIGRRDPPFPISAMRARAQVTEIRVRDLRFSVAETELFFNKTLGVQIDAAAAAVLEKKTEGWVTGLRLAALSMRQRTDIDPKLLEPHVDAQYVMEYLFTEVFSSQPPEISRYLLGSAILDRFCGPLCEAVCEPGAEPFTCEISGWEFIEWLKKENLFVIPLDPEKRWLRYHHLFRKLLFNQLKRQYSAEDIKALHCQASAWFADNGLIEEALQQALTAGDIPAAIKLVSQNGYQLMNDQQWPRLSRWLDLLPRDQVEQNPEVLLLEAWLHHIRHDVSNQMKCLERIEAIVASCPPDTSPDTLIGAKHIQGQLDALRGMKHYLTADGELALCHLQRACKNIPLHFKRARVFAHISQLGAYQMMDKLADGLATYQEEMRNFTSNDQSYQSTYLTNLCIIYWMDADLIAMRQTAESALNVAGHHQLPDTVPYVAYFQGIFHYHRNELIIAEEKLTEVVEVHRFTSPMNYAHSAFALALTSQARHKTAKAREISEAVITHAIETNNADMLMVAEAFRAELSLRQGRIAEANKMLGRLDDFKLRPIYRFYFPQLTLIRILLARGTMNSRRRAADLLDQSLAFFKSIHNKRFQIDLLALQALLHDSQNNGPAALKALAEALAIAEPSRFIRLFVDLGPRMADLLKQLIKKNVAVEYGKRILDAFKEDDLSAIKTDPDHPTTQLPPLSSQPQSEPLTNRELEVLELLVQRFQNKEIAEKLFISPETVKKHLHNIYGKLNVGSRRQAVDKARMLGILKR